MGPPHVPDIDTDELGLALNFIAIVLSMAGTGFIVVSSLTQRTKSDVDWLIMWLGTTDLCLASSFFVGFLMQTALGVDAYASSWLCTAQALVLNYLPQASLCWVLAINVYMSRAAETAAAIESHFPSAAAAADEVARSESGFIRLHSQLQRVHGKRQPEFRRKAWYIAVFLPMLLLPGPALDDSYGFLSKERWCWINASASLWRLELYAPIIATEIVILVMYCRLSQRPNGLSSIVSARLRLYPIVLIVSWVGLFLVRMLQFMDAPVPISLARTAGFLVLLQVRALRVVPRRDRAVPRRAADHVCADPTTGCAALHAVVRVGAEPIILCLSPSNRPTVLNTVAAAVSSARRSSARGVPRLPARLPHPTPTRHARLLPCYFYPRSPVVSFATRAFPRPAARLPRRAT